jgi:hypothetical protein
MQLQKADLENLFYAWLVRKLFKLVRFGWDLARAKPATRWFFVMILHGAALTFFAELFKGGVITDPKKKKWIRERELRVRNYIDAKCEAARSLPNNN